MQHTQDGHWFYPLVSRLHCLWIVLIIVVDGSTSSTRIANKVQARNGWICKRPHLTAEDFVHAPLPQHDKTFAPHTE